MELKKTDINLVPDTPNPTPDYYCTWQTQLYATCDGKPIMQRKEIGEAALFEKEKPHGWAYFYPEARRDLFIVMDDSWDVPLDGDGSYLGCLQLNPEKFPESTKDSSSNAESLRKLTDRIKALGWKGLGGWVCCQESPKFFIDTDREEYWKERLLDANSSGFSYWKVDWGNKGCDADFRRFLTKMGRKYAPKLIIEQAMLKWLIPDSDTYRTYDVPGIASIPMTMEKLREFSDVEAPREGNLGLINCEDEVYIGAAGGYAFGVMRHPYSGDFMDGRPDPSFPNLHRNIKTKITEVTRAARWHRIAPAFAVDKTETIVDTEELSDTWLFIDRAAEMEAWWFGNDPIKDHLEGELLTKTAPARISRRCPLPSVTPDKDGNVPFVVAAQNPNGVFSIVTAGRTFGRDYYIPRCDVTAEIGDADTIGVFGEYKSLLLKTSLSSVSSVLMQDLASNTAYDVTEKIGFNNGYIVIPGKLISSIGTMAQPDGDTSEPGVVIKIK